MPNCCVVPNCTGNYRTGPKVTVFSFPKDELLKKKWIHAIKRGDGFQVSNNSKVCEAHFKPHEIIRKVTDYDEKNGKTFTVALKTPKLQQGAVPSQFPNCPSYMSSPASVVREAPDERRVRLEVEALEKTVAKSMQEEAEFIEKHGFETLEQLKNKKTLIDTNEFWTMIEKDNKVLLLNLVLDPSPQVKYSVVIDADLTLNVYVACNVLTSFGKKFILPMRINSILILNEILNLLKSVQFCDKDSLQISLDSIKSIFNPMKEHVNKDYENALEFIFEQITLLCKATYQVRYSPETLIFSSLLFYMAPHSYKFLRQSGNVILPHPSTIRRVCLPNIGPQNEQCSDNFLKYVKHKFKFLSDSDKKVVLMVDEIYVKPYFDYKGGNITGISFNNDEIASSARVFMLSSLLSSYRDVVHIVPVKSLVADILHDIIKKVVIGLESIGFQVIAVVTDNNSINRKAMSSFINPPSLQSVYPHPVSISRPLFFFIDSVHLLKCIRNNWVNQKNPEKCMFFPPFNGVCPTTMNENFCTASLSILKQLHASESTDLLKYSFNLSYKALTPTNFEKQNVKLVLQLFNEHVSEGLLEIGGKLNLPHYKDTANYLKIINTWWSIVNVKSPFIGVRLNNMYKFPLTKSSTDERILFLHDFVKWLESWESMCCDTGMLTRETHSALKLTINTLLEITSYCCNELGLSYVLPGKFQTDQLEARFSQYRQLGGAQYHISMRQIYETENKLRTQSFLKLSFKTKSFGEVNVLKFDGEVSSEDNNMECKERKEYSQIKIEVNEADINAVKDKIPIITYLGGYCARKALKHLGCSSCKEFLVLDKDFVCGSAHVLIHGLDRGKLLYPQDIVVKIVLHNYIVIEKLCLDYEKDFLTFPNQRSVAIDLTVDTLNEKGLFEIYDCCEKGHLYEETFKMIVRCSTNTLLNNFCKRKNDHIIMEAKKNLTKKRKLETLKNKS